MQIQHNAAVRWSRDGQPFLNYKYSRKHLWSFQGGAIVRASASPQIVEPPYSDPKAVCPEEAIVAAAASSHMMWFLYLAAKAGLIVEKYADEATALMDIDADGTERLEKIELRPTVTCSNATRDSATLITELHREAIKHCAVANALRSQVTFK
jgi:organic hydroperoxide reductase OsmC/OhrA